MHRIALVVATMVGCVPPATQAEFGETGLGDTAAPRDSSPWDSGGRDTGSPRDTGGDTGGGPIPECTESSTCDFGEVCASEECTAAFGRRYDVVMVRATFGTTNFVGDSWDVFGGAPDPFVVFGTTDPSGEKWVSDCFTSGVTDSFSAEWNEGCVLTFVSGNGFSLTVYDEDVSDHDVMMTYAELGDDEVQALLRSDGRPWVVRSDRVELTMSVTPTF